MPSHPSSTWIIANWESLQKYADQWIAASEGGLLANDSSVERVIEALRAKQQDFEVVTFAYIFATDRVYQ
jgi:hypothetical protein